MLKTVTDLLVFGTYLIVAVFLGFVLWQSLFSNPHAVSPEPAANVVGAEDPIATYTRWLAVFTALLVAATVALFVSGERNVKVAEAAADAAKRSADAVASLERPYFFNLPKIEGKVSKEGPFDAVTPPIVHYTVHNIGRAPGILRSSYASCYVQRGPFPDQPIIDASKIRMAQIAIAAGVRSDDLPPCKFEQPITKQDWLDIVAGTAIPVLTTVMIYEGPLDYTYVDTTSFRLDLFEGAVYPLGLGNYSTDQTTPGRISKGTTVTIANVKFKPISPPAVEQPHQAAPK